MALRQILQLVLLCFLFCYFNYRAFHISGMEDLLLYLASSEDERQFMFHVLEIISLMFREQVIASPEFTRCLLIKICRLLGCVCQRITGFPVVVSPEF